MPRSPEQLGDRRLRSGHALRRHAAHRVPLHEPQPDPRVDESLAQTGVVAPTRARARASSTWSSSRSNPTCCASVDTPRSKPSSPIAMRHPSSTSPTTSDGLGAGVVEEHLVELAAAGDLLDRPHLDAGLVHRHQQERQTLVPRRLGIGAGDHEAPVRHVRERGPHLLTVRSPTRRRRVARVSPRWRGRSRRSARCSPGTIARRRAGCRAGTAPAGRACRTRSAWARAGSRPCG